MTNDSTAENKNPVDIRLDAEQHSVAPGGSTDISIRLHNQGEEHDYFELSVKGLPAQWVALPAVIPMASGERKTVTMTIEPRLSESRVGRYSFRVEAVSQEQPHLSAEVEGTLTIAAFESPGRVGLLMESLHFSVSPGGGVTVPLVMHNRGLEEDTFRLSVEGIPTSWVSTPSAQTRLEPGEQKSTSLTVQPPVSPHSRAGRHTFTLRITSQQDPSQIAEAECTLTLAAFSQFSADLYPRRVEAGRSAHVRVENQGNVQQGFTLSLSSQGDALTLEPSAAIQLRVPPGEAAVAEFRPTPRRRPLLGGAVTYPYTLRVLSSENESQTLRGEVLARGIFPVWLVAAAAVLCLALVCVAAYLLNRGLGGDAQQARATQTAAYNQTQAALIGEEDTDGDGLTNREELELGTNPLVADTDEDGLSDSEELRQWSTDPLTPDTDGDGLTDGEEVLNRGTDPLKPDTDSDGLSDAEEIARSTDPRNPDTDGDGLIDGDEVQRETDPRNSDTDGDGLQDGEEVDLGTNPRNADTDNDRLDDGRERELGTDPLNPDSDEDGIIDGLDLDPLDPANPSITATAAAQQTAQVTPEPELTDTPEVTPEVTETAPSIPADLPGTLAFRSNREGNPEIYSLNMTGLALSRLTLAPGVDSQPAWSPDKSRLAFTSNRDGNNEIYLMNADGTAVSRLTDNPADDQDPTWSTDGGWIAFTSNRDGDQEIFIVRVDGSDLTQLTDNQANDSQPSWYSDQAFLSGEQRIAFSTDRDGNLEIYSMAVDGSDQTNLTNSSANETFPSGSPGGGRIAYTSNQDGNQEIYIMFADGSSPLRLTNNSAADRQPAWGPDGNWVAFVSERDGDQEIYVVNVTDGTAFNLTQNPAEDVEPAWR